MDTSMTRGINDDRMGSKANKKMRDIRASPLDKWNYIFYSGPIGVLFVFIKSIVR